MVSNWLRVVVIFFSFIVHWIRKVLVNCYVDSLNTTPINFSKLSYFSSLINQLYSFNCTIYLFPRMKWKCNYCNAWLNIRVIKCFSFSFWEKLLKRETYKHFVKRCLLNTSESYEMHAFNQSTSVHCYYLSILFTQVSYISTKKWLLSPVKIQ